MLLKPLLLEILSEQESEDLLEFPDDNFTVSIDRNKKRFIFAPQQSSTLPSKLRTILVMIKQNFNVSNINSLEDEDDSGFGDKDDPKLMGSFELVIDPREDFEDVIQFIKDAADEGNEN